MSVNLDQMSSQELAALIKHATTRKKILSKRKPANQAKAAVAKTLKAMGWTLEELFGRSGAAAAPVRAARKSTKGRRLGKVAPKYRNPAKATETWSGRGRQPLWLATLVSSGRKADEFLIK